MIGNLPDLGELITKIKESMRICRNAQTGQRVMTCLVQKNALKDSYQLSVEVVNDIYQHALIPAVDMNIIPDTDEIIISLFTKSSVLRKMLEDKLAHILKSQGVTLSSLNKDAKESIELEFSNTSIHFLIMALISD